MSLKCPIVFGHFRSKPVPYNLWGTAGYWSVPAGHSWPMMTDKGGQIWVSPNPLTKNPDGTVSGSPLYAAELNQDGTLVFQEQLANRKLGIDSPPPSEFGVIS